MTVKCKQYQITAVNYNLKVAEQEVAVTERTNVEDSEAVQT